MSKTKHLDRLPPHDEHAEMGVLGAIMLDPVAGMAEVAGRFPKEMFYDGRHQTIFEAMVATYEETQTCDTILLQGRLKTAGLLEQVGGLGYLATLPDQVPSAANLGYYLTTVRDLWLRRRLLQVCAESSIAIYEFEGKTEELLDRVEADVMKVADGRGGQEARSMPDLVTSVGDLVERMHRGVGIIGGLRTRFGYFDKMTGGLHRKELAVIAARPSLGKTSLLMNMAVNVAKQEKVGIGIFSMEMSSEDVTLRMICAEARVDFHKLRTGFPSKDDLDRIRAVAPKVAALPIFIDDSPALGILELRSKARRMVQKHNVALIGVDYLQLMHGTSDYHGNRAMEVQEISGGLKAAGKELNVAMVVLSQLNREVDKAKYRKPQLSDLRESGAIEQDADMVAMLYRPKRDNEDDDEDAPEIPVNLSIAKQRNGPTGDVELTFHRKIMQMADAYENRGKRPEERSAMPTNEELGVGTTWPKPRQETNEPTKGSHDESKD